MIELHLTKKDFRIDWFSGTGAGGQYRNKHQNCCRIIHIETGLMATGQAARDRPTNQKHAFKTLVRKLLAYYEAPPEVRRDLSNVARTYHFERNVAYDENVSMPIQKAMDGNIDPFIESALKQGRKYKGTGRA